MESVQVEIFGQVYSIKGVAEPEHIRELAAFLDAKMKEVQAGTGTVDPRRVAILAALTISDELHSLRERHRAFEQVTEGSVLRLLEIISGPGRPD